MVACIVRVCSKDKPRVMKSCDLYVQEWGMVFLECTRIDEIGRTGSYGKEVEVVERG